jgi:hypothetical protein
MQTFAKGLQDLLKQLYGLPRKNLLCVKNEVVNLNTMKNQ